MPPILALRCSVILQVKKLSPGVTCPDDLASKFGQILI